MQYIKQTTDELGRQINRKEFKLTKKAQDLIKQIEDKGYKVVLEETTKTRRGYASETNQDYITVKAFDVRDDYYPADSCSFTPSNMSGFYFILEGMLNNLPDIFANAREVEVIEITDDLDLTALLNAHSEPKTETTEDDSEFDFFALFA